MTQTCRLSTDDADYTDNQPADWGTQMLADAFRSITALSLIDEDGDPQQIALLPPAAEADIDALEANLPCRLPVVRSLKDGTPFL